MMSTPSQHLLLLAALVRPAFSGYVAHNARLRGTGPEFEGDPAWMDMDALSDIFKEGSDAGTAETDAFLKEYPFERDDTTREEDDDDAALSALYSEVAGLGYSDDASEGASEEGKALEGDAITATEGHDASAETLRGKDEAAVVAAMTATEGHNASETASQNVSDGSHASEADSMIATDENTASYNASMSATDEVNASETSFMSATDEVNASENASMSATDEISASENSSMSASDEINASENSSMNATDEINASENSSMSATDDVNASDNLSVSATDDVNASENSSMNTTDEFNASDNYSMNATDEDVNSSEFEEDFDEDDMDPDLIPRAMLPTPETLHISNAIKFGSAPWHEAMQRRFATRALPTLSQIQAKINSINDTLDQVGDMVGFLNNSVNDIVDQVIDGVNQTMDALDQINKAAEAAAAFGADDIGKFITSFALYMKLQVEDLQSKMLKTVQSQIYDRLDMVVFKFTEIKTDIVSRFDDIIAHVMSMVMKAAEKLPSADTADPAEESFTQHAVNLSELANFSNASEYEEFMRAHGIAFENGSLVNMSDADFLERVAAASSENASLSNDSLPVDALERLAANASENLSLVNGSEAEEPEESLERLAGNASENLTVGNGTVLDGIVEGLASNASEALSNRSQLERFLERLYGNASEVDASEHASFSNASELEESLEQVGENASDDAYLEEGSSAEPAFPGNALTSMLLRMGTDGHSATDTDEGVEEGLNSSEVLISPEDLAVEKLEQLNQTVTMVSNLLTGLNLTAVDMVVTNVLGAAKTNLESIDSQCFGAVESAGGAVPDIVKPMMKILCSAPLKLLDQLQPKVDEVISMISVRVDQAMAGLTPLMSAIEDLSSLVDAAQDVSAAHEE